MTARFLQQKGYDIPCGSRMRAGLQKIAEDCRKSQKIAVERDKVPFHCDYLQNAFISVSLRYRNHPVDPAFPADRQGSKIEIPFPSDRDRTAKQRIAKACFAPAVTGTDTDNGLSDEGNLQARTLLWKGKRLIKQFEPYNTELFQQWDSGKNGRGAPVLC